MGVKGVLQQGRECGREKRVGVRRRWIDKQKLVRARVCEVIAEDEIGGGDVCERGILEKKPLAGELNEIRRMAEKRHFFRAMNGLLLSAQNGEKRETVEGNDDLRAGREEKEEGMEMDGKCVV